MSRWSGRLITKTPVTPGGSAPNASAPGIWTLPEMAYWKKRGLWPDASADAYWGYVSYLMATSSLSNASNNLFVDSSGAFSPVSRVGNTTQGSVTPYGTLWSNYFPGAAGSYLSAPNNAAFQFGTGDLTIEAWIFISGDTITNPDGNRSATICSGIGASGVSNDFWFNVTGNTTTTGTGLDFQVFNGGSGTVIFNTAYSFSKSTWYHVAFTRSGNNVYLFVNGTLIASSTYSGTITVGSNPLLVGYGQTGSVNYRQPFFGYISNLRIVKGTALYTSAFTPSTTPLTAVSGTSILTCQSNRFRDASTNNFTITAYGNTSVTPYSPFVLNSPGAVYNQSNISYWSGYFDGSGDYLRSNLDAVNIRTAFTIEAWVNLPTAANFILFSGSTTAGSAGQALYLNEGSGTVYFGDGVINNITFATSLIPVNAWVHVACTFDGTTYRVFINGTSVGSSTTLLQNYTLNGIDIGGRTVGATVYTTGYISNFRVVKGSALYTSNFTPPTTQLTAISGTSLLTLQNAAFTDNSPNNYAITAFGNTTVTGNNPFQAGYYSNYFDGSGDYLTVPSNAALDLTSGDFTIELWYLANSTAEATFLDKDGRAFVAFPQYAVGIDASSKLRVFLGSGNGTSSLQTITTSYTATTGTWTHVAVTRIGTTITVYANGVSAASVTQTATMVSGGSALGIGCRSSGDAGLFNGYLSNIRIVKGTAVYTGNFTPSTTPLTAVSGTSLLTCRSNGLADASTNAFTVTKNGDVTVQTFNPFYSATPASNGGSAYFDGNDYLSIPNSTAFQFGTGDFTIECWVNKPAAVNGSIVDARSGGTGAVPWAFYVDASNYPYFYDGSLYTSTVAITNNAWNHIAVVRTSGVLKIFVNGAQGYSAAYTASLNATGSLLIGGTAAYTTGYIADLRITKGTAVYTSAFTPPTTPLTATANTSVLCNFTNGGIYDAAMQNNLETVGNAQVSSAQAKYGTTSAYFDGSGDGLLCNGPSPSLVNANFTWECWVNFNSLAGNPCLINVGTAPSDRTLLYFDATNGIRYAVARGNVDQISIQQGSTSGWSTGVWYHVALVRNGNTYTIYRDGTSVATGTSTYAQSILTTGLTIGYSANGLYLNGYLDDVRVTNGVARYTANFTSPTAALPVY